MSKTKIEVKNFYGLEVMFVQPTEAFDPLKYVVLNETMDGFYLPSDIRDLWFKTVYPGVYPQTGLQESAEANSGYAGMPVRGEAAFRASVISEEGAVVTAHSQRTSETATGNYYDVAETMAIDRAYRMMGFRIYGLENVTTANNPKLKSVIDAFLADQGLEAPVTDSDQTPETKQKEEPEKTEVQNFTKHLFETAEKLADEAEEAAARERAKVAQKMAEAAKAKLADEDTAGKIAKAKEKAKAEAADKQNAEQSAKKPEASEPEKTEPEKTEPETEEAVPEKPISKEGAPEETVSKETVPAENAPDAVTHKEAAVKEAVLEKPASEGGVQEESTTPKETVQEPTGLTPEMRELLKTEIPAVFTRFHSQTLGKALKNDDVQCRRMIGYVRANESLMQSRGEMGFFNTCVAVYDAILNEKLSRAMLEEF